jgi:hypothetical protein
MTHRRPKPKPVTMPGSSGDSLLRFAASFALMAGVVFLLLSNPATMPLVDSLYFLLMGVVLLLTSFLVRRLRK